MDDTCLQHRLTDDERIQFDEEGFLVVKDALPQSMANDLAKASDRIAVEYREKLAIKDGHPLNLLDVIGKDDGFLPLLDWPKTFMKVVDVLGWHIQLYHSHLIVTPPLPADYEPTSARLGWHQDSGRLNIDLEGEPRPRISLKVGFFFSDVSSPERGNFHVIPGSHRSNRLTLPDDDTIDHPDAIPVVVDPGDAVFFDRRLWHAAGRNRSEVTRKVLFLGYSYRWLKPRDDMTVDRYMADADPIRRQLLGASPNGGFGFTSPADEDVPLKTWLVDRLGADGVVR